MTMRYLISIVLALLVALGLFAVMNALVNNSHKELADADDLKMIDFVRVKQDETVSEKKRQLPKKPPPKRPPPPPEMKVSSNQPKPQAPKLEINVPKLSMDMNLALGGALDGFGSSAVASASGGPTPLNQFDPQYPRKALRSGAGGLVEFKFVVDKKGQVSNIQILKEQPRGKGFAKSVKKAAKKWRFKPAMKDGKPVEWAMQLPYEFVLE